MMTAACDSCSSLNLQARMRRVVNERRYEHLNCRDFAHGYTLLHIVVRDHHTERGVFDSLTLNPNINLEVRDFRRMTPLLLAIEVDAEEFALDLIARGSDVNAKDPEGANTLMLAARSGNVNIAHAILKKGIDVNDQDYGQSTALHHFCCNVSVEMMDLLIFYGADPRFRNDEGDTVFMRLLQVNLLEDDPETVECQGYMIDFESDMNEVNCMGFSTLFLAIMYESPLVEEIINRGANINYVYEDENALRILLQRNSTTPFLLIWSKISYELVYTWESKPMLCDFFNNYVRRDWLFCFHTVCNSDIIEHAIQHYQSKYLTPLMFEVITAFASRSYKEEELFPYVCILLSFGTNLVLSDLETLYIKYGGNNSTIRYLIKMDIELEETVFISHPYMMLNVTQNPADIYNNYTFPRDLRRTAQQIKFLPDLFQVCTPTPRFFDMLRELPHTIMEQRGSIAMRTAVSSAYNTLIHSLSAATCFIPTLQEITRNAIRALICRRFHVAHYSEYLKALHRFSLPPTIENVLLFKIPASKIVVSPPQIDLNPFDIL